MNFDSWFLFASIALIATVTPGPAILLVSTHSVSFGTKYSIATMAGNVTGLFIMSLFSVMGLSTIILHSAPIFFTLKLIGAFYLVFLGLKLWRNGLGLDSIQTVEKSDIKRHPNIVKLYANGLLVALTNPKAIAFTTALFPQFIQPDQPMTQQFSILIITFMSLSFVCLLGYAMMAEGTKKRSAHIKLPNFVGKVFGCAFIGSGVFLATATQE
jgi:homoserine/homoserine lactone efflux protein